MANANFANDFLSSTLIEYYKTRPSDAVFGELVLWDKLKRADKITKQGGQKIVSPVMTRKSTAVFAYDGYDTFDMTPQEVMTNAEWDWKWYGATVVIDNPTRLKNRGPRAEINILKNRIAQAEMSLADKINADAFLDGVSSGAELNKTLVGLALMVDNAGTYGNINRSTDTYWKAQETAAAGDLTLSGSTGMRRMFNDCALGPTRRTPDFLIGTQAIFEAYETLMDSNSRFMVNVIDRPNATFKKQNLMFRDAELYWDDYCQSQTLYFLNSKHMAIVELEGRSADVVDEQDDRDAGSFRISEFVEPYNQDAQSAKIKYCGNMLSDNCRRLGKLTGITNS